MVLEFPVSKNKNLKKISYTLKIGYKIKIIREDIEQSYFKESRERKLYLWKCISEFYIFRFSLIALAFFYALFALICLASKAFVFLYIKKPKSSRLL